LRRARVAHDAHRAVVVQHEGLIERAGCRGGIFQSAAQRGEQHHEALGLVAGDLQARALELAHALDHAAHAAPVGAARVRRLADLARLTEHQQREPRADHGEADDVDNGGENRERARRRCGCWGQLPIVGGLHRGAPYQHTGYPYTV